MTPETDAKASDIIGFFSCATVPAEFARNLERERDEAIRQRDETNRSSKYACDYNYEQKLKAERERDEARKKWKEQNEALRTLAEHGESEMQKLIKERDELRYVLYEIANASHFNNIGNWARNKAKKALDITK